jgi:hypothetical protein
MPSKHLSTVQKTAHPTALFAAVFFAAWELVHATRLLDVLWEDTPAWLKTFLVEVASIREFVVFLLGFIVGSLFVLRGWRFLRKALIKLLSLLPSDAGPSPAQNTDEGDSS